METKLTMILRDIYGGDGVVRLIETQETKLSRTKKRSTTRSDIGIAVESATDEVQSEKSKKEVNTFSYADGKPILRLGGAHGKLWGTFKDIRTNLYTLGNSDFRSKRIVDMIQVIPVWVPLEPLAEMETRQLPQILNNMGRNSMIIQLYDVIPRARCEVTLVYPDSIKAQIKELIKQLSFVSFLNKRRATVESTEITKTS